MAINLDKRYSNMSTRMKKEKCKSEGKKKMLPTWGSNLRPRYWFRAEPSALAGTVDRSSDLFDQTFSPLNSSKVSCTKWSYSRVYKCYRYCYMQRLWCSCMWTCLACWILSIIIIILMTVSFNTTVSGQRDHVTSDSIYRISSQYCPDWSDGKYFLSQDIIVSKRVRVWSDPGRLCCKRRHETALNTTSLAGGPLLASSVVCSSEMKWNCKNVWERKRDPSLHMVQNKSCKGNKISPRISLLRRQNSSFTLQTCSLPNFPILTHSSANSPIFSPFLSKMSGKMACNKEKIVIMEMKSLTSYSMERKCHHSHTLPRSVS